MCMRYLKKRHVVVQIGGEWGGSLKGLLEALVRVCFLSWVSVSWKFPLCINSSTPPPDDLCTSPSYILIKHSNL